MCFPQHFVLVLPAFIRFWYTYICFDTNYRTAEVASIQMLLAQWIWGMAYFRHFYYYGHLLSIIKICNPEETCCYARPASVVINSNTGLKCWQNVSMSLSGLHHRVRRFYDLCLNIGCFAIETRVKQKFSTWLLLPVITKYVRPYFQLLVDKGLI